MPCQCNRQNRSGSTSEFIMTLRGAVVNFYIYEPWNKFHGTMIGHADGISKRIHFLVPSARPIWINLEFIPGLKRAGTVFSLTSAIGTTDLDQPWNSFRVVKGLGRFFSLNSAIMHDRFASTLEFILGQPNHVPPQTSDLRPPSSYHSSIFSSSRSSCNSILRITSSLKIFSLRITNSSCL